MDIFLDETKTRYKGSICLDKEAQPIIVVKPADDRSSYYMILKVGKNSYHFTTDSQRELKEWAALLRQIVDPGITLLVHYEQPLLFLFIFSWYAIFC